MIRSPFKWFGGKSKLVSWILPFITEHDMYIEPYFGGGSVFFSKPPAKIKVINDTNPDLVLFLRILRDRPDELIRMARLTPYSRELFDECKNTYKDEYDEVLHAWKWWVIARMSFGGMFGSGWGMVTTKTSGNMSEVCRSFINAAKSLDKVSERLQGVAILNEDAVDVMKEHASHGSLCYCDPPYLGDTRKSGSYEHEMSVEDHIVLLNTLNKLDGKVLLSGYPSDLYNDHLKDWECYQVNTVCHSAGKTKNSKLQGKGTAKEHQKRTECLWLNKHAASCVYKQTILLEAEPSTTHRLKAWA